MAAMWIICQYRSARCGSRTTDDPVVAAYVTAVVLISRGCDGGLLIRPPAHCGSKVHRAFSQKIKI